jgi:hypothetical protein
MKDDLTYGKNFADFLGSFWSSIFDDGDFATALGYSYSECLIQGYMDLIDVINSTSISTLPVFSKKNIYPVKIYKKNFYSNIDFPEYGDGSYYGIQPESSKYLSGDVIRYGKESTLGKKFFVELNSSNLRKLGSFAFNRLFQPSVTYINGSDFILYKNGILFNNDPFLNDLIPKRKVIIDRDLNELDEEIVLWFCDVDVEEYRIYEQYGYMFTNLKPSSEEYKQITKKLFELISLGPSLFTFKSYLSIISGSPIIRETEETVESIEDTPEGKIIITNYNVYKISEKQKIPQNINIGSKLRSGTPLTDIVDLVDTKNKNWWSSFSSLPLPSKGCTNTDKYISFPNSYIKSKYGKKINFSDEYSTSIYFDLIGQKDSINLFWKNVEQKSKQLKQNYGYNLFKKYSTSENKSADFINKKDLIINPAQIFANDFFDGCIIPIKIKISQIKNPDVFFKTVDPIRDNTPVNTILMLFFYLDKFDEYLLDRYRLNEIDSVNLNDLLENKTENYPADQKLIWHEYKDEDSILEAISIEVNNVTNKKAGRFYKNNFNQSNIGRTGFLLEEFDLSITTNLSQNVELRQISKCVTL